MKKPIRLLLLLVFATSLLSVQTPKQETGSVEKITLDMLNAPVGLYRTYEDFINKTPDQTYNSMSTGIVYAGGKMSQKELTFYGKGNKNLKLKPSEVWGWKEDNGEFFRFGPFNSKLGKLVIRFRVAYVSDFIMYHPEDVVGSSINPSNWYSNNFKSEIKPLPRGTSIEGTNFQKIKSFMDSCTATKPSAPTMVTDKLEHDCTIINPYYKFYILKVKGGMFQKNMYEYFKGKM